MTRTLDGIPAIYGSALYGHAPYPVERAKLQGCSTSAKTLGIAIPADLRGDTIPERIKAARAYLSGIGCELRKDRYTAAVETIP